ncbi:MAG: efflux RND transporter permease subunit, partial [Leptospiraceae bacterium]|nr:efflux RND transporter permease subunit [Leptospiraceae bacterium]
MPFFGEAYCLFLMRALIGFFLSRSLLVNVLLIGIFGLALASLSNTNRNAWPEVDLSTMQIITRYPGASPRDVEQNVTRLIEDELRGIVGIKKFTSVSAENVSTIIVKIDINHPDQDEVKDEVRRAVDRVSNLPAEVAEAPLVRDLLSTEFPIITVGISGEVPYEQLRQTAKLVERDLRTIRGVSKIDLYAYRDYEFQVDLDPDRLRDSYIALNDVLYAIDTRNVRATGGNLESYRTQRNILTLSQFESVEDVREVILRSAFGGGQVLLKDVGTVTEGFEDERMRTIF